MNRRFPAWTVLLSGLLNSASLFGWIQTDNRWLVREFANTVFPTANLQDMGWTGDYGSGNVGTVSETWQQATLLRVNTFRAMAGVPAVQAVNPILSGYAQEAAFMMSVNNAISHFPPQSWQYYTENAALAAQRSNLAWGSNGPYSVNGYMADFGAGNEAVGHRRWVLFPNLQEIGNGDAPGDADSGAASTNTLWVIPDSFGTRPETRDPFVAWPPPGHIPAGLVFARWSFSLPGADFSNAVVSMTMDGQPIPFEQEPWNPANYGEPAIVWVPDGLDDSTATTWPNPAIDETISVRISDVLVNGSPQDFDYDVTIFDPSKPGPEEEATRVTINSQVRRFLFTEFAIQSLRDFVEDEYDFRTFDVDLSEYLLIGNSAEDYEDGAFLPRNYDNAIQNDQAGDESYAYHLSHPDRRNLSITLRNEFLGTEETQFTFKSSLSWATENQAAIVEINKGDGDNWQPVWEKIGPIEGNTSFETVVLDLSDLVAEQTFRIRFTYALNSTGSAYYGSDSSLGWRFNGINMKHAGVINDVTNHPDSVGTNFSYFINQSEPFYIQVRERAFGGYPLDWSAVTLVEPVQGDGVLTDIGHWIEDPVIGWNFATSTTWTNVLNWQWLYFASFPWLYTSSGWFYYASGSVQDGMWFFHTVDGWSYTHKGYGGWYVHEPFDAQSWRQFNP